MGITIRNNVHSPFLHDIRNSILVYYAVHDVRVSLQQGKRRPHLDALPITPYSKTIPIVSPSSWIYSPSAKNHL
jgi:hypothetical protein